MILMENGCCCRIFKYYLQQSPVDFLNACCLKVSCRLLDTTDQTITEIALACGFTHLSYFSKLFCAAYGYTPREYRRLKQLSRMTCLLYTSPSPRDTR